MSIEVIYDSKEVVKEYLDSIFGFNCCQDEDFSSIAMLKDNILIGAVLFHNYKGHSVEITMATTSKYWCTKNTIRLIAEYAFNHLKVERVQVECSKVNKPIRRLLEGTGFIQEGCLRKAYDGVIDAIMYRMLKEECKWL